MHEIKLVGISKATQESHVQELYNEALKKTFNLPLIERKYQCDGYFKTVDSNTDKEISVLIEYKYDIHMKDKVQRARVIAQCLAYLRLFELNGESIPKMVFIGDINECMLLHTNDIIKLLDLESVNWELPPSSIGQDNNLVLEIINAVNPWVYDVDEKFDFTEVTNKIVDSCNNIQSKLHITEKNIEKVYNLFCDRVIKDKKKVQANDLVGAFIGTMLDCEHYYQHPRKKNILVANDKNIAINGDQFELFMSMHNTEYSPKEKRIFTSISDRLIEDTNRRNKGEFYTPTLFVDYAHGMIEKELGVHWKEHYTVWDCCCGTKNLTRDYRFKDLYCSTLEQAELDISRNYNKEACSFQFDFLNDSLDDLKVKAPGLLEALELNKPICFFINPPYATTNGLAIKAKTKSNIATTKINLLMKENKIGRCSENLYAQFLYRIINLCKIYNLQKISTCVFSPITFLTNPTFVDLRNEMFKYLRYNSGCYFNASNFGDVAPTWGISFSILSSNKLNDELNNFKYKVIENKDGEISVIQDKVFYNQDSTADSLKYLSSTTKGNIKEDSVSLSSGLVQSENVIKFSKNGIGYASMNNQGVVFTLCKPFSHAHGIDITADNFTKIVQYISSRNLISRNWINCKDSYFIGEENSSFISNSIVYSVFHEYCQCTSLDNIKNEFFWMSKQEMMDLAEKNHNDYTYEDALNSDERFVYNKLQEIKDDLSPEAKAVLDKATELVKESFKYRELFNESHPEYQINNWDCGWYQIKALLKEFMPNELKEFRQLYKQLADKMRPMVYELGFLRK